MSGRAAVAENRQTTADARRLQFGTSLESLGFGLIGMPGHDPPRAYHVYSGPGGGAEGLVFYIEQLRALMAKSPEAQRRYEMALRDAMDLLARGGYAALRRGERGELEKVFRFLRLDRVDKRVLRRAFLDVLGRSGGRAWYWRTAVWRTAHDFLAELREEGEEVRPEWGPAIADHAQRRRRRAAAEAEYAWGLLGDRARRPARGLRPRRGAGDSAEVGDSVEVGDSIAVTADFVDETLARVSVAALVRKARALKLLTLKQNRLARRVLAGMPMGVALKELDYSKDVERGLVENLRRAAM